MESKQKISTGYAPVHKGKLYYETAGEGFPVLLIHAGVAECTMWDNQMEHFSLRYQTIRYDARGFGRSESDKTEFSNRQDILDLFQHLGIEKAAIIGISRGGQIAIDFTLEHPERVAALVAVAPGISGYEYQAGDSEQARHENDIFEQMDALWQKKAFDKLTDLEVHVWADGPAQPLGRAPAQVRDYLRKVIRANHERNDDETTHIPLNPLAIDRLAEIHSPTLILVGEYDFLAAHAVADELECQIAQARLVGIPAAAHMIPLEQPERFNRVVLEFLKDVL